MAMTARNNRNIKEWESEGKRKANPNRLGHRWRVEAEQHKNLNFSLKCAGERESRGFVPLSLKRGDLILWRNRSHYYYNRNIHFILFPSSGFFFLKFWACVSERLAPTQCDGARPHYGFSVEPISIIAKEGGCRSAAPPGQLKRRKVERWRRPRSGEGGESDPKARGQRNINIISTPFFWLCLEDPTLGAPKGPFSLTCGYIVSLSPFFRFLLFSFVYCFFVKKVKCNSS